MFKVVTSRCIIGVTTALLLGVSCGPGEVTTAEPQEDAAGTATDRGGSDAAVVDASVPPNDVSSSGEASGGPDASGATPLAPSADGLAILEELRSRFTVLAAPPEPEPSDDESGEPPDAALRAPVATTPLESGLADGFDVDRSGIRPHFPTSVGKPSARTALGQKATASFRVEDAATGTAVDVSLRHTRDVSAQSAAGYLVYRQAHASGATILHRALAEGTEEFLSFETRPSAPELTYDVTFVKGVSGLRLVANTLEMLDAGGAPRLRVSPPSILGADGSTVEATLAVDECAFDADPAPPWDRAVIAPGADKCTVRVTWPGDGVSYPALLDPKWSTTGNMVAARKWHTTTLLSTGKVLAAGGTTNGTAALATAELFDPSTGTWAATGSMTGVRWRHSATQLGTSANATTSGKVLIAGGWNGTQSVATSQLYAPSAGTWVGGGGMGTPRHLHTATLLSNGRVLVAGGMGGTTVFQTASIYNPASGNGGWNAVANMATARRYHSATLLSTTNATLNNKVLVVGGNTGGSTSTSSVQLFDSTINNWVSQNPPPALPAVREGHTATVMSDGKVLVAGGKGGSTTLATAVLFNPASGSGSWASAGTMTAARQLHTATLLATGIVNNGQVLVAGGSSNGTASLGTAELFTAPSTWTATTALLALRREHTANLLNSGLVLIAGGVTTSASVATAEVYDPSSALSCTTASQCVSGFCVNGVCCNAACTGECEACNLAGTVGNCLPKPNLTACTDDGNVCTLDRCNGTAATCQHIAAPIGTSCSDGALCNGNETCAAGAVCTPGTPPALDDGNPCTTDTCDPATGDVVHTPVGAGTSCSDSNACNGVEVCDANGACLAGTPVVCGGGDQCHLAGTCEPATGLCSNPPLLDGLPCNDGDACTRTDVCAAGLCAGTAVPGCAVKIAVEELETLPGSTETHAWSINDSGVVIGTYRDAAGVWRSVRWSPAGSPQQLDVDGITMINNGGFITGSTTGRVYLYSDATGLQFVTPAESYAGALSGSNAITGYTYTAANSLFRGFRYTPANGYETIAPLPGDSYSFFYGIDEQNNAIGKSGPAWPVADWWRDYRFGGRAVRFVEAASGLQDLSIFGPLGWRLTEAWGTNGNEVVGAAIHERAFQAYRLTLSDGRVDDLGSLGGVSFGWRVNSNGAILGRYFVDGSNVDNPPPSFAASRMAVYTEQLGIVELEAATDPALGWTALEAYEINSNGDIVGTGQHNGATRPFRMHLPGLNPARVPRCQTAADCATGFCVEGICCNTACDGQCSSCRLPGSFGTCSLKPAGTRCSNGNQCTSVDTCNTSGVCVGGVPPVVDDGNLCTTDSCNPVTGVSHVPVAVGTSCSDGNACNGAEMCAAGGVCTPGTPVVCPGADQCRTAGTCDTVTGLCSNVIARDGLPCNDNDACTRTDVCAAGVCAGSAVPGCAVKIAVEELGTLGGSYSNAFSINNAGVVVGASTDAAGVNRPVRWTPGGDIQQLGTQTGYAWVVNDTGTIGGSVDGLAFFYTDATGFQILTQAGTSSDVSGLNNQGSAAGNSWTLNLAFRYTNAKGYEPLGFLPGRPKAWAWDIDEQNNAVGSSYITSSARIDGHAIRYIDAESRLQDLNEFAPLGWELRDAIATNGDEIVGYARMDGEPQRAYRLTVSTGRVDDLGPPARSSGAGSINAHGAVALIDWDGAPNAATVPRVYTEQLGLIDLNMAADPAQGWVLLHASWINDNGDVVGWGQHNGQERAFRMHLPGLNPARVPRCQTAADCATGFCVEGICCNTACDGQCSSCRLPGTFGTCTQKREGSRCTNGNQCTSVDTCNASGVCVSGGPPVQDDGNPCTTDTCDPVTGVKHTPVAVGTSCTDNNACNGAETCAAGAVCTGGTPPVVDDGNPCTQDSCDPAAGPVHAPVPVGVSCSDGNACNGAETCNASGACTPGTPLNCGVADQCHLAGTCDPLTGLCSNPRPNGLPCNDSDACTRTDVCQAGVCVGTTVPGCATKIAVEDLGTLGGYSAAYGISNSGVVVGQSADAAGVARPVRWLPGGSIQQLGTQAGIAYVVNDTGTIGGGLGDSSFLYTDATGFQIITQAGTGSAIDGLNNQGSAAGWSWTADLAFRYTNAKGYETLGFLPSRPKAWAWDIDEQNNVVGSSWITSQQGDGHAIRYIDAESRLQDLNEFAPLGWELRDAISTNGGEVVGYASVNGETERGFRFTVATGKVDDLGALTSFSGAASINGHGAVTGWGYTPNPALYKPTVYTEQLGLIDLNAAADPAQGWELWSAPGINDNGDVIGYGKHNGEIRAFRMHVPGLNPARVPRCQTGAECATGFCVEGICCNTACNDACSSCRLPGTFGTCSPRAEGSRCSPASICDGGGDVCDASGACVPGSGPPVIDDGNPCTIDSCNPSTGAQHVPVAAGTSCSDGNACNGAETCNANGQCTAGTGVICGVPAVCHLPGICDPASGVCSYPPAPSGTLCGDTNVCNGVEMCDGSGTCVISGGPPETEDGNPCTDYTGCDPVTGPIHTPRNPGAPCDSLCLTGGVGTCDASHTCVGGTAVTCTALDQCHGAGTCNPMTGGCSNPPLTDGTACDDGSACTQGDTCQGGACGGTNPTCSATCPCDSGRSCATNSECKDGLICGTQNGRFFGKDPLSSNCWYPDCASVPDYMGCGETSAPCGLCPPAPPRVCTSDTTCQTTNEICGQGNGAAFGLGNTNVCWPPVCPGGQTFCGSPLAPCGNCSCATSCASKSCSTPNKDDDCGGYCAGLCGDGQTGCASNIDCQNNSVCVDGTCLPPICLELDPSRGCPNTHAACPNCPQCASLCETEGRECGPDPGGCSAGCGGCSGGLTCIDGRCLGPAGPPLPPVDPTVPVGALEGSFDVTDSGQAQYGIQIAVPPGRAGLKPDIGLVYSSDKKLGPAGIGWRLTGFSQIARCSTRAADEGPRSVKYTSDDRLCLDGRRLVAFGDGTYRTEVDQFSKITVTRDSTSQQPISFKVYTKAGTILTYGDTEDSSIYHALPAQLPTQRLVMKRSWAVSHVEDRNGNSMRYTYETRRYPDVIGVPPTGVPIQHDGFEMVPIEVSYGANTAGFNNDRGVRFIYRDFGIRSQHYASGGLATTQKRLDQIETYARNGVARRYKFDYEERGLVYRLLRARDCAPGTPQDVCKPPTTFTYDDGFDGSALGPATGVPNDLPMAGWHGMSHDSDGDGDDDITLIGTPYNSKGLVNGDHEGFVLDLNNDGHEEVLLRDIRAKPGSSTQAQIRVKHGPAPLDPQDPHFGLYDLGSLWAGGHAAAADLDGDGLKDILICQGNNLAYLTPYINASHQVALGPEHWLPSWGTCESEPLFVDIDDDGVANLLRREGSASRNWQALVFPESGTPAWVPINFDPGGNRYMTPHFRTLDANGDGLVDVLVTLITENRLLLNQGDGNFRRTSGPPLPNPAGTPPGLNVVFDVDGDGNDDLLGDSGQGRWLPPGFTWQADQASTNPLPRFRVPEYDDESYTPFFADTNGDGDLDLVEVGGPAGCKPHAWQDDVQVGCPAQIRPGRSRRMNLLTGIVDGVGRKITIVYDGNQRVTSHANCAEQTDLLCPRKFGPLVGQHTFSTVAPDGNSEQPHKFFEYTYADARAGTKGRGSYGFGRRTVKEFEGVEGQLARGPLFSTTELAYYNRDFVRAGLLELRTVTTAGNSQSIDGYVKAARRKVEEFRDYTSHTNASNGAIRFPILRQSKTTVFDEPPFEAPVVVSTEVNDFMAGGETDYDDWGNSRRHLRKMYAGEVAQSNLVVSNLAIRNFDPDPSNWLVGLLSTLQVEDTRIDTFGNEQVELRFWSYGYYPDGSGRLQTRTRDPGGAFQQVEEFYYDDAAHNLTKHILQPGNQFARTTRIEYDDASLTFPWRTRNPLNHLTETIVDPRHGGVISTKTGVINPTDPNGLIETRTYDGFGRLTKVQGPSSSARFTMMRGDDEVPPMPGPDPRAAMRVWTEELSTSGATGSMKFEDFDALGRIVKRDVTGYIDPVTHNDQWVEETFHYDPSGRLKRQSRPHLPGASDQGEVRFEYDDLGELTREIHPEKDGSTTSVYHARATRNTWLHTPERYFLDFETGVEAVTQRVPSTVTAAAAFATGSMRVVDASGLTVIAQDARGELTDYAYGPFGQLVYVQVGRDMGPASIIEYEKYGRKLRHNDPDTGVETYDLYDAFDQLRQVTNARGVVKKYDYDQLGRTTTSLAFVTGALDPDEETTWDYDGIDGQQVGPGEIGRLVQVSSGNHQQPDRNQIRYFYQGGTGLLEGVTRTTAIDVFTTGFNYEGEFHRLRAIQYPSGLDTFGVRRDYDSRGNLVKVSDGDPAHNPYWQVTGTSQGYRIASETFGNNAVTDTTYEPFTGRLESIRTASQAGPNGVTIQGFDYAYTPNGNLRRRNNTTAPKDEYFGYDELDRLTSSGPSPTALQVIATYDFRGRIETKAGVGTYDYTGPGPLHAPRSIVKDDFTRTFQYDPAGNEIIRTGGPENTRETAYTSFNLPTSITDTFPQAVTTTFEYDGDQSRVIKVVNLPTGVRQTVYAGSLYERIIDSTSGATVTTHKYRVFADGKQVAQVERSPGVPGDKTQYLHGDHLGSALLVTKGTPDASSNLRVHQQTFDPWGKEEGTAAWDDAAPASVRNVRTGFTGHEHDSEHKLINMRGRLYDPELGRFTTADPIVQGPFDSQSFNRYAYVFNNPLKYTDPSGFEVPTEPLMNQRTPSPKPPIVVKHKNGNRTVKFAKKGADVITPSKGASKPTTAVAGADATKGAATGPKENDAGQGPGTAAGDSFDGGGSTGDWDDTDGGGSTGSWDDQPDAQDTGPSQEGARIRAADDTDRANRGGRSKIRDAAMGIAKLIATPVYHGAALMAALECQFDVAQELLDAVKPANETEAEAAEVLILVLSAKGGGGKAPAGPRTPVKSGTSRAPKVETPNSIYEQVGPGGKVRSRTFYDDNGRSFSRQDFDHSHGGVQPHEHLRGFDDSGRPVTPETVRPVPPGYDTTPTNP